MLGVGLASLGAARFPVTLEEAHFVAYGGRILSTGAFSDRLTDGQLPVAALLALPLHSLGERLPVQAGRAVSLVSYLLLCGVVWRWAASLYGRRGALGAVVLTAFCPAFLAQAGVMTAEMIAVAAMTAAVFALARCLRDPTLLAAALAGVWIGVALLTDYLAIVLLPVSVLLVLCRVVAVDRMESRARVAHGSTTAALMSWVVAVLVLDAGFLLQGVGTTIAWLDCQSQVFQLLRAAFGSLVLPLPRDYLIGLDRVLAPRALAEGLPYLVGDRSVAVFEALPLWGAFLFLALLIAMRRWRRERRYDDAVLVVPVVWLVLSFGVFSHPQIAVRFLLFAIPFLVLLAAGVWEREGTAAREKVTGWLLVLQAAAVTIFWLLLGPR